jgi:hypothetical protein
MLQCGAALMEAERHDSWCSGLHHRPRYRASLATPTDLGGSATKDISGAMNAILADTFALYLKTKSFRRNLQLPETG